MGDGPAGRRPRHPPRHRGAPPDRQRGGERRRQQARGPVLLDGPRARMDRRRGEPPAARVVHQGMAGAEAPGHERPPDDRGVVRPDPEPRRLPVHVRPAGGPAVAEEPPRQRPRRRRPGEPRQPDHAPRRRGRQPELPRALEVRRRGVRLARLGRDLPRTLTRLGAGDAGARRGAPPRAARVPHQLSLVRGAPALSVRLPGEHALGRRPALRRVGGHGQEAGRAGLRPGGRRGPVHDERRADGLRVLRVRRAEHHARAGRREPGLRLRLPRQRGRGRARVHDQPPVRVRRGEVGGRPEQPGVAGRTSRWSRSTSRPRTSIRRSRSTR